MSPVRQRKIKTFFISLFLLTLAAIPFQNCARSGFDSLGQSSTGANGQSASQPVRNVKVAWDKSPSAGVQGYRVYIGTSPGVYDKNMDAGVTPTPDSPQFEITDLEQKTSYFVVIKAYDQSGESGPSNEIQIPAQ